MAGDVEERKPLSPPASEIGSEDARTQFADLLGRVAYGREEFVITKHGKPVARLIPIEVAA